ncbi:CapA family protein [Salinimicrobium catena]|uniref:CapA family protein n=1 Tax=Salinimicrobium catena TaxID=390640 RepID=UPI002FE4CAEF
MSIFKPLFLLLMIFNGFNGMAQDKKEKMEEKTMKIFLCGDVMLGRGIDQALPHSVAPVLYESYVKDARDYIRLAERENGELELPVSYNYIWGDALEVWKENAPDLRLINLETSITTHDVPWKGKGIHYRMHPKNVEALKVAKIDHVSLANNHVLDWGRTGLKETFSTLKAAGIGFSGAGVNAKKASEPSVFSRKGGRVLVFSYGSPSSGIPYDWAAEKELSGVNFLPSLDQEQINIIKTNVKAYKEPGDLVILSLHWGGNWGYDVPSRQRNFAHNLIDEAGVDAIYGHSSHHPMGIEVYRDKMIIYGAGDFINDYEGISGHEEYRSELTLMYFPQFEKNGKLKALKMVPMRIKNLQLHRAKEREAVWLRNLLKREGRKFGSSVKMDSDHALWLVW